MGARNHKFFVNFLEWAAIFCMWTFATLVAGAVHEGHDGDLDAEYIVIVALYVRRSPQLPWTSVY